MTYQEKALTKIAKTIKQLDSFAIEASMLDDAYPTFKTSRNLLFTIIKEQGYELSTKYKLVKIKKDERNRDEEPIVLADQIYRI